jgi:PAS domain S-box-containing protein
MENAFAIVNAAVIAVLLGVTWWYARSTSRLLRQAQDQVAAIQGQAIAKIEELEVSYTQILKEIEERQQAEDKLRESEARFAAFMRHLPGTAAMRDIHGRYLFANETWEKVFRRKWVDWWGKTLEDVWPADFARSFQELDQQVIDGGQPLESIETLEQDGQRLFWLINRFPILNQDGQAVMVGAIGIDITARRQAEEALRESEKRYRLLAENVSDVIWTASLDYGLSYVSPSAQLLIGYSPEELLRMRMDEILTRASLDLARETFAEGMALERRKPGDPSRTWMLELEMVCKDGSTVWTEVKTSFFRDAEGRPVGILGVSRDISQRKLAELAVRRREAILEAVSFAAERFLQTESWEEDIQRILARLGQAVQASRVYISANSHREDAAVLPNQGYEWIAPGITPQMDHPHLQNLSWLTAGSGGWAEELSRGRLIVGHVGEFPLSEKELLTAQNIKSILVVPVFTGQEWWGVIGFDECTHEREWLPAELEALKAAASTLGAAILHERAQKALKASEQKLRALTAQLLSAQENERKRLAAELHDELGHALLTLKLKLESLEEQLQPQQVSLKDELRKILGFISETIGEVRRLYLDLSPGDLEDLGLTAALHSLIEDFVALQKNLAWTVKLDNLDGLFALPIQTAIYRVVQEALTNIGKHAKPNHVSLEIKRDKEGVSFTVNDDGKGFDKKKVLAEKKTLGLLSMEERVKILGGAFELWSQKNRGTRISFTIPLPEGGSNG